MGRPIYILFCNDRYGSAYEAVFRKWCRDNRLKVGYLIIRSARNHYSIHRPYRIDRLAKDQLHNIMRNLINLLRRKTVFIENINRSLLLKGLGRVCSLMGFIAGFNQIFHEETIRLFVSLYNFHPSLLPYYRGPVPSYWCIKYGELFSGVTLHTVTPRVDQGHIVGQETIKISTDDPEELDDQISMVGSQMFVRLLSSIAAGTPPSLNKVQAESIYSNLIDYRSFPTVDDQKKGAGDISHDTLG